MTQPDDDAAAVESAAAGGHDQAASPGRMARWLPVAANVGALLGLLLVALELRQNRELTRAQIRHDLAMGIVELLHVPAGNLQLAGVLQRAAVGEPLTADERFQFRLRSNALLRYWEDVHYQYRQGLYDEVEFLKQQDAWRAALEGSKGFTDYWCEVRSVYSPLFMEAVDELLAPGRCPAG
ncbi:MAG: hypothetical protein R2909_00250 [Gemmatimonadales bacterium]